MLSDSEKSKKEKRALTKACDKEVLHRLKKWGLNELYYDVAKEGHVLRAMFDQTCADMEESEKDTIVNHLIRCISDFKDDTYWEPYMFSICQSEDNYIAVFACIDWSTFLAPPPYRDLEKELTSDGKTYAMVVYANKDMINFTVSFGMSEIRVFNGYFLPSLEDDISLWSTYICGFTDDGDYWCSGNILEDDEEDDEEDSCT